MGYVMFRLANKFRLIGKLRGVRNDLIDYDDTFWEVDSKTPIYVDRFDDVWNKAQFTKDVYDHGSCYIKITEDNEIECEFNEDESIELENGEVRQHGLFQVNER